MRIITGKAGGIHLDTLKGDDVTRPTPERVKEAIFSMLQFEIEGTKVLDLFGGSGQLALEALSRGATGAVICDANKEAVEVIRKNAKKTGLIGDLRIFETDYKSLIRSFHGKETFDLVFLDPPYALKLIPDAIDRLLRAGLLAPDAVLVCESDSDQPVTHPDLILRKFVRYGRVHISVLVKEASLT
ncbi:MAG: 16S rRNA (guanine(966)-N(2))-methyltransferase RsmD [Eubacteriales bacterium]